MSLSIKPNRIVVGIPARMASSRFPGKPLCTICNLPMIEHVYRRCSLSARVHEVFIAACDIDVEEVVKNFGGKVIMTDPDIARPALRVAVASEQLGLDDNDIVVVVQGDEPLIRPEMLDLAIQPILEGSDIFCVNLVGDLSKEQWLDSNEIKVVADLHMNAIYMSRSPIPSSIHPENQRGKFNSQLLLRQVCVFTFRYKNLKLFNDMKETPLEQAESIELLRAIEHGEKIRLVHSPFATKSVDTEQDRYAVEQIMATDPLFGRVYFRP